MLFFQNYSNLYPPNKTLCAHMNSFTNKISNYFLFFLIGFITK
ncbi:hypothetical protein [Spiroplasma endosymbiont of Dilophus febrilis]